MRIRLASYNVHQCVGADGRRDPRRIAQVIREMKPHVIGVQEVTSSSIPGHELDQLHRLSEMTDLESIAGPTLVWTDGRYGNGLLTSGRIVARRLHDLSVPHREPRGAIDADIEFGCHRVRFIVTHLGLRSGERRRQAETLLRLTRGETLLVLMGDFNEWHSWSRVTRLLQRSLGKAHWPPTFPARRPWLRLDRIWVKPPQALDTLGVHLSDASREASDHLPLLATMTLDETVSRA